MSDIMKTMRGKLALLGLCGKLKKQMSGGKKAGGFEVSPEMMQMMGSFTLLRLTGLVSMMNIEFTKEELLALNAKLNKIKKK
jgi:beta-galactosidase